MDYTHKLMALVVVFAILSITLGGTISIYFDYHLEAEKQLTKQLEKCVDLTDSPAQMSCLKSIKK